MGAMDEEGKDGPERRKHARRKKGAPLILIERAWAKVKEGVVLHDVSLGGLAFEILAEMKQGDDIRFTLYIPERGWAEGTGKICWVKPNENKPGWLCGASITIDRWDQRQIFRKWLHPHMTGWLKFFMHGGEQQAGEPGATD